MKFEGAMDLVGVNRGDRRKPIEWDHPDGTRLLETLGEAPPKRTGRLAGRQETLAWMERQR